MYIAICHVPILLSSRKNFYKGLFKLDRSESERVNKESQVLTSLTLQFGVTAVAFIAFFASLYA